MSEVNIVEDSLREVIGVKTPTGEGRVEGFEEEGLLFGEKGEVDGMAVVETEVIGEGEPGFIRLTSAKESTISESIKVESVKAGS